MFLLPRYEDFVVLRNAAEGQQGDTSAINQSVNQGDTSASETRAGPIAERCATFFRDLWQHATGGAVAICHVCDPVGLTGAMKLTFSFLAINTTTNWITTYYASLFSAQSYNTLIEVFAILQPAIGIPACLICGQAGDYLGLPVVLMLLDASVVVLAVTYVIPILSSQYVAMVFTQLSSSIQLVIAPPFVMRYSPPRFFGAMNGAFNMLTGILSLIVGAIVRATIGEGSARAPVAITEITLASVTLLLAVLFYILIYAVKLRPIPELGSITMAHECGERQRVAPPETTGQV